MFVVKHKKVFFAISVILVLASLGSIFTLGLNLGTDFTGGTVAEFGYRADKPVAGDLSADLSTLALGNFSLQTLGNGDYLLKMKPLTEADRVAVTGVLARGETANQNGQYANLEIKRFNSVGPAIGSELKRKGMVAIVLAVIIMIAFMTLAFLGVSRPVASWKYGVIAVVALLHDIIISTGAYVWLGKIRGAEIDALFLTAILTIVALSVNDTIVVFDRVRENLKKKIAGTFEGTVGASIDETFVRSLITSLTVIFVLVVLYFFGSPTTKDFALVLAIGMFVGTYSSIFLASPMLIFAKNLSEKGKK